MIAPASFPRVRVVVATLLASSMLGCELPPIDGSSASASTHAASARDAGQSSMPRCTLLATATPHADAGPAHVTDVGADASTLLTFNLDWFGDPDEGPSDDATQYSVVRDVLAQRAADLVALEEVASEAAFERLLDDLPRYAGVLSGYSWTQKTALLWDRDRFELRRARALSGLADAGRPPLVLELRRTADGQALRVLVIHAKAQADAASYAERVQFALGLKAFLDGAPELPTIVAGDFNDLLDGSITSGQDSPYRPFVDDPAYAAPTRILDRASATERSFAHGQGTIDHVLLQPAPSFRVDPDSVDVLQDELLPRYPRFSETASDHFPVVLTLRF